jgi:pyruvate/2-oxoacid:ferredoxin oxidoreductase beta subunit
MLGVDSPATTEADEEVAHDRHRHSPDHPQGLDLDQEVRWCPGCGDYSILAAVQMLMPELGVRRENTVFVSGIGCAAASPIT